MKCLPLLTVILAARLPRIMLPLCVGVCLLCLNLQSNEFKLMGQRVPFFLAKNITLSVVFMPPVCRMCRPTGHLSHM